MSPTTHTEALARHLATTQWLWSMHGGDGEASGAALVEAYAREGVYPSVESADAVLVHLEQSRVIERARFAPSASQRFFDTRGRCRSKHPELVAPASFFVWRPASGSA